MITGTEVLGAALPAYCEPTVGVLVDDMLCDISAYEEEADMNTTHGPDPRFNGECAFAVSLGKRGVRGRESHYVIEDGRKYLFSNAVAKLLWKVIPGRHAKAHANWQERHPE